MRRAASHLVGTHDFSAFRAAECQARTPVKTMYRIDIGRQGDLIVFTLKATAFLHHMVRNIVGSLILCGNGNQPPEWMRDILEARDRSLAAPTFMPDGLYLAKIDYDPEWRLPVESSATIPWLAQDMNGNT
jgi:tRNA pseudouridine38-40 synthase